MKYFIVCLWLTLIYSAFSFGQSKQTDSILLHEVVVRENYEKQLNKREALSVEVIKKDFIIENNGSNLIKTIEKLPGVYSMDIGAGFSKPVIRGMGFNRVAVSENGIKQESQQWGADHGLEIDQFNVEKMEVYKGPMSLQYGSDAVGGVLEIVPASVPKDNKVFSDVIFIAKSVNSLYGISAMVGAKRNNWYGKMRITEQHFGDYHVPTDTFVYLTRPLPIYHRTLKNTAGMERDIATTIGYSSERLTSNFTISNVYQNVGFFSGSHGIPDINRLQDDGNTRNIDLPRSNVNHLKIINNTVVKFDSWKVSSDIGFQNNTRQEWAAFHTHYANQNMPLQNPDLELGFNLHTYTANIKLMSKNINNWRHTFGVSSDFQQNRIDGYNFLLPRYTRAAFGVFAIESYQWSENVLFNAGMRYDVGQIKIDAFRDQVLETYLTNMNSYTASEIDFYSNRSFSVNKQLGDFSWSAGAVYTPDNRQNFKINLGRSFRLPAANELASNGVHHGTFRHEIGDTSLVSEKGYQLDVAYTYDSDEFYFSINPFASWFSNYIYLSPSGEWSVLPHAGQLYRYTQAEAFVSGGECSMSYEFVHNYTFETGLEYVYLQNLTDGYPLPYSPPASVVSSLTWHWHNDKLLLNELHIGFEHRYIASQTRIARNEEVTDGTHVFNVNMNNTFGFGKLKVNMSVQVQNVFDTKYYNHLSFYRKLNIPEPGRNIQLIVRIPIN